MFEAALPCALAGWRVEMDPAHQPDRFEEGPTTLLALARRDRRWCQGNLQQYASGRCPPVCMAGAVFVFIQGITAYLGVGPAWGAFLIVSLPCPPATQRKP